jgi:hypothetical protein
LRDGTYREDVGNGDCENTKGKGTALQKVSLHGLARPSCFLTVLSHAGQEGGCD